MSIRAVWVTIHRWVGLALSVVLIVEGLTGSLIAFRAPLSRWLAPTLYAEAPYPGAKPLPLAQLAVKAQQRIGPTARVAYFFDGSSTGQTMVRISPAIDPATHRPFTLEDGWIALDPWTGRELARYSESRYTQGFWPNVMPFVYAVHTTLTLGTVGNWILGIVAILWTIDCFYAVYLTFPRGWRRFFQRWKDAWRIKTAASVFRLQFDLHRAGGLWFWPLLLVFAWSSVELTLYQVYEPITAAVLDYRSMGEELGDLPQHSPAVAPQLDWSAAQASGDAIVADQAKSEHFKTLKPTMMAYFASNGIYSYSVATDRRFPQFSSVDIWFDGDTGQLVKVLRFSGEHSGNTVTNWLRALHFASDPMDSLWYRWLICLIGVYTVVLSVTGIYLWWKKRAARHWSREHGRHQR